MKGRRVDSMASEIFDKYYGEAMKRLQEERDKAVEKIRQELRAAKEKALSK